MKTDENVEKVRTVVRTYQHFRHESDSGGVAHGQGNGETNFKNKFEHEKHVCQNGPSLPDFSWETNTSA
jgi:hypothetical protein